MTQTDSRVIHYGWHGSLISLLPQFFLLTASYLLSCPPSPPLREKQEAEAGSHGGRAAVRGQQQQPDEAGGDGHPTQDAV